AARWSAAPATGATRRTYGRSRLQAPSTGAERKTHELARGSGAAPALRAARLRPSARDDGLVADRHAVRRRAPGVRPRQEPQGITSGRLGLLLHEGRGDRGPRLQAAARG